MEGLQKKLNKDYIYNNYNKDLNSKLWIWYAYILKALELLIWRFMLLK